MSDASDLGVLLQIEARALEAETVAALRFTIVNETHALTPYRQAAMFELEGERLRLWPYGELWVDAHTFASRAKHAKIREQREEATRLYRGDLLPEDELDGLSPLRTRLRLMHLELLRDPDSGTPSWVDLREPVFSASV